MTNQNFGPLDLDSLVGKTVDEARAVVEASGRWLEVLSPGSALTADLRPGRVRVYGANGKIKKIPGRP